jgi:hypothetical protein
MAHKLYLFLSGLIFFLVSLLHFLRLVYGWPVVVGPWTIPYTLSYVGCPAALGYSVWAAWLFRHMGKRQSQERAVSSIQ